MKKAAEPLIPLPPSAAVTPGQGSNEVALSPQVELTSSHLLDLPLAVLMTRRPSSHTCAVSCLPVETVSCSLARFFLSHILLVHFVCSLFLDLGFVLFTQPDSFSHTALMSPQHDCHLACD